MKQLGELKENADKFSEKQVEVIAIFREENAGLEGLQKTREKTEVDFTLGLDHGAGNTSAYSSGKGKFHSYVVGSDGVILGVIEGDLTQRAKSEQLLEIVNSIQ